MPGLGFYLLFKPFFPPYPKIPSPPPPWGRQGSGRGGAHALIWQPAAGGQARKSLRVYAASFTPLSRPQRGLRLFHSAKKRKSPITGAG